MASVPSGKTSVRNIISARLVLTLNLATPKVLVVTMPAFCLRPVAKLLTEGDNVVEGHTSTRPVLLDTIRPDVGDTPQAEIRPRDELAK